MKTSTAFPVSRQPGQEPPHTFQLSRWQGLLGKIALELGVVVAGVVIALLVDNWRARLQDQELLETTLESLSKEFSKNTANVHQFLPRQQRLLDTLLYYREAEDYSLFDMTTKAEGMGTAELYTTNWQASLSNNSLHFLNFETVNLLSQIESKHDELKTQEISLVNTLYSPALFKRGQEGDYRRVMELWLRSYMGNEHELLALYERFKQVVSRKAYQRN